MYIEHINLTVRDLDRSARFYGALLGMEERWRGTTTSGKPALHIGNDRCYFALFQGTSAAPDPDYDRAGFNHVGIVVDDLDAAHERLIELGAPITGEHDYEPGRRLYFRDPDNIEVELVTYAKATVA